MFVDDAYPHHFAAFLCEQWDGDAHPLPERETLDTFISSCYQASLLQEEERPVMFRAILCGPERLPADDGPPSGLHRLEFPERRPFDAQELRRLSPAADYYRSLIGVEFDKDRGLQIWGLVHSGPRWLRADQGGRAIPPKLPPALILRVNGPGRMAADAGPVTVGKLEDGKVSAPFMDVFKSHWLPDAFAPVRSELAEIHKEIRGREENLAEPWAPLDNDLTRVIGQHTIKRIISAVRNTHHGGTLVISPPGLADVLQDRYVALKYKFADDEPRRRFRTLIVEVMNNLARSHGHDGVTGKLIGWDDYEASTDEKLSALDEAIFEVAHLISGLTAVDGAFVMTQRFELLGFGGEISGSLPEVKTVAKALDIEGEKTLEETIDGVGTRHRSAYRLCNALPEVIAVVISQDGNIRCIQKRDGAVTYWDQA
jgi:hypothetical protein